jgi:hypothetical protein
LKNINIMKWNYYWAYSLKSILVKKFPLFSDSSCFQILQQWKKTEHFKLKQ